MSNPKWLVASIQGYGDAMFMPTFTADYSLIKIANGEQDLPEIFRVQYMSKIKYIPNPQDPKSIMRGVLKYGPIQFKDVGSFLTMYRRCIAWVGLPEQDVVAEAEKTWELRKVDIVTEGGSKQEVKARGRKLILGNT